MTQKLLSIDDFAPRFVDRFVQLNEANNTGPLLDAYARKAAEAYYLVYSEFPETTPEQLAEEDAAYLQQNDC